MLVFQHLWHEQTRALIHATSPAELSATCKIVRRQKTEIGNEMTELPIIAMTMGDAAGVGPEVIMKSLAHAELHAQCRALVIGDAERLRAAGRIVGSPLEVRSLAMEEIEKAEYE